MPLISFLRAFAKFGRCKLTDSTVDKIDNCLCQTKYLNKPTHPSPAALHLKMNIQNKLEPLRLLRHLMSFFCPVADSEPVSLEIVPWDLPLQLPVDLLVSRGPRRNWETAKPGATFGGRQSQRRQVRSGEQSRHRGS